MVDVFISYSHNDRPKIATIAEALTSSDVSVWWDRAIRPTANFSIEIEQQLQDTRHVLVAWSAPARKSLWVRGEALMALEHGKLVQLMLDDTSPPVPFNALHALNFSQWHGDVGNDNWVDLVSTVRGAPSLSPAVSPKVSLSIGVSRSQVFALWLAPLLMIALLGGGVATALNLITNPSDFFWFGIAIVGALIALALFLAHTAFEAFKNG